MKMVRTKEWASRVLSAIAFATLAAGTALPAKAQPEAKVYTPAKGSPDRKAILDTVRPLAERDLGAPIEFIVGELNVAGAWSFVALTAQRPGGGAIDRYKTPFARRNGEEAVSMFDCCHVEAVLHKTDGKWHVVESGVGTTDVWYTHWCNRPVRRLIAICASLSE